jgi:hypothetical protein
MKAFWLMMAAFVLASRAAAHEQHLLVGRSAAGQIKVELDLHNPVVLKESIYPGITGFATGEIGVHSTILDEATNDFFQLSSSANFQLILVAKDPGIELWNDHGSGFMEVGELFFNIEIARRKWNLY